MHLPLADNVNELLKTIRFSAERLQTEETDHFEGCDALISKKSGFNNNKNKQILSDL